MKILLSGSNGSFGSALFNYLYNKNYDIDTVSLRYEKEFDQNLKDKILSYDVFIHCGALIEGDFDSLIKSNTLLTKKLLDFISKNNPKMHFIYFSTMSLLKKKKDIVNYDYANFRDMTDYAVSKYISEIICSRYRYRIPITILRFSTIFFKDPIKDGLSKLVCDAVINKKITIYNNGEAKRDFIPLDIAVKYVKKVILNEKFYGKTLNIVSGTETSFKCVANFLDEKIEDLKIHDYVVDLNDNVPINFNTSYINMLGEIEFELFDEIYLFLKSLVN